MFRLSAVARIRPLLVLALAPSLFAQPLTFSFTVAEDARDPFAREIWADVRTPNGRALRLPAFYDGGNTFAVRARPEERGVYLLTGLTEVGAGDRARPLQPESVRDRIAHDGPPARPSVTRDLARPTHFRLTSDAPYVPIGANLPWPAAGTTARDYYRQGIPAFGSVGLNWMRIWMCHWGGLNPDWLPERLGPSPAPGALDLRIAATWDELLALAEKNGVYVQVVLQHHGQFSTAVNPNWDENPWNAANPHGFLDRPAAFFTSERARELTKRKYRAIVARHAWSPAVAAWELFNEVHWVDALRIERDVDAVARWHDEMAHYLRRIDPYHHLVATSTDDLRSPLYAPMDFFQPHIYPSNVLAAVRTYHVPLARLGRPVFYGEFGDDHQPLSDAEKKAGHAIVPPVWASLMGAGALPAQPWLGWNLLELRRIGELGAVAKFLAATRLATRAGLAPFEAVVESRHRVPLVVLPGQVWQRRPAPIVDIPLDGRQPLALADVPRILAGNPREIAEGLPQQAAFRLEYSRPATLAAHVVHGGNRGARVRVLVDGEPAAEHTWPARERAAGAPKRPAAISFDVPPGAHIVALENPASGDAVELDRLDLGVDTAALAAIGKRSDDFIALWLWHRTEIFAVRDPGRVDGTVRIEDVPADRWRITWWDTFKGEPSVTRTLVHRGGALELPTPRISRHAAVTLERLGARQVRE